MKSKISVIVVTYNGIKWIGKCLESIHEACRQLNYHIHVVDNGSTDGTQKLVTEKFPNVNLIALDNNLGFGRANNIGITRAYELGADYFWLLNQDVYVSKEALASCLQVMQNNDDFGIVSSVHTNCKGNELDGMFGSYAVKGAGLSICKDVLLGRGLHPLYEVDFVNAACWLVSRKCIEIVGGFDPIFLHYGEDNNYCHRVQYHGLKIGIATSATIVHDRTERKSIQTSLQLLSVEKRMALIQLANPLWKTASVFRQLLTERLGDILGAIIRLKFGATRNHLQILFFILRQRSHAIRSVDINRSNGMHYLSLDDAQK